ncbi:hypothetical protein JTE90_024669 [Oedothorax gibbosus]|uniref:Transposable element P transposase n=1 Tax=Oedothorax gibbosus TaxID=931172 RepID=A0AAV6TX31_9ARAC|nr:hypothetical protein JTE90_024669 [Oedothorax gibbosus]
MHVKSLLLTLPCKNTLKKYTGNLVTEDGVNSLIKERLVHEVSSLDNGGDKFASIIIDEMAIQPKCLYDKPSDTVFGFSSDDKDKKVLANRLLCFVIHGLSINYSIPCAYYFTKNLAGKKLYSLFLSVLKEVEECGFIIVRVVTDNHKTNVLFFKKLSKSKQMQHKIEHPLDENRPMFLSFDPSHLIKNIRNQFLDREMSGKENYITGNFVKKLYEMQEDQIVKPVRFLTRKHVYPNNLEKMNVLRAVQVFSAPVIATIQFFRENCSAHPQAHLFREAGDTLHYMTNMKKWFEIHDVGNRTLGFHSKNANKEHFFSITGERLQWLETEFPSYMKDVEEESLQSGKYFLTPETYSALLLTSLSTTACVRYLLESGFHYVLTRKLSSDPVESLFSAVRQMNGGNDASDAKASTIAINKILRTGLLLPHHSSNGESLSSKMLLKTIPKPNLPSPKEIPGDGMDILEEAG